VRAPALPFEQLPDLRVGLGNEDVRAQRGPHRELTLEWVQK
jgi:hypothetical protein